MRRVRYTREEAAAAVVQSRSFSEALRRLGLRVAGGNHATLKKYVELWGLSVVHFDRNWAARRGRQSKRPISEILVANSTYSRSHLKERLFAEGLKEPRCELCGLGPEWRGRRMALILDHVNGDGDDNRLVNLRIVCPNCAATLDTHCGRKNQVAPVKRQCAACGRAFLVRYPTHRYCSQPCGSRAAGNRQARPLSRKVVRPSRDSLVRDVEVLGYAATGRKYGVSDNSVRKWLRWSDQEKGA